MYITPSAVLPGTNLLASAAIIQGDLVFRSGSTLIVPLLVTLAVNGSVSVEPAVTVRLAVSSPGTFAVLTSRSLVGTFDTILESVNTSECFAVQGSSFIGSTLSVTVTSKACEEFPLLPVIIGPVVGCGVLLAIVIIVVMKRKANKNMTIARDKIKQREMEVRDKDKSFDYQRLRAE